MHAVAVVNAAHHRTRKPLVTVIPNEWLAARSLEARSVGCFRSNQDDRETDQADENHPKPPPCPRGHEAPHLYHQPRCSISYGLNRMCFLRASTSNGFRNGRSEERRVGKECRSRGAWYDYKR